MAEKKSPRRIRDQVEACLTSDLDEAAKTVWVFLFVCCGGGLGTRRLAETLQMDETLLTSTIEILRERGVIVRRNGTWRAGLFEMQEMIRTPEEQEADDGPARAAARVILDHYQEQRTAAGVAPLFDTRSALVSFAKLARWLNEYGVHFDVFLEWAQKKTKYLVDAGKMPFPSPQILAGPFLAGEWLNGEARRSAANSSRGGHAGRTYRDPGALRERLMGAGFARARAFAKSELRHVLEYAENMLAIPEQFEEPDPEYHDEIVWLVKQLGAEDAARA